MSFDIAKYISINEKANKIMVTSACNNVYPHTYEKWEYSPRTATTFEDKVIMLLRDILDGNIHINQSVNARLMRIIGYRNCDGKYVYNDYCCSEEWNRLHTLNNTAWGFDCEWRDRDKPEEVAKQQQANELIKERLRIAWRLSK